MGLCASEKREQTEHTSMIAWSDRLKLGDHTLKNRVVMAAMTRLRWTPKMASLTILSPNTTHSEPAPVCSSLSLQHGRSEASPIQDPATSSPKSKPKAGAKLCIKCTKGGDWSSSNFFTQVELLLLLSTGAMNLGHHRPWESEPIKATFWKAKTTLCPRRWISMRLRPRRRNFRLVLRMRRRPDSTGFRFLGEFDF